MTALKPMRELPTQAGWKKGDVMVVFGELFSRGYANGIVDEAEKAGLTVIRSTVGRRDAEGRLRPLQEGDLPTWPPQAPFINIPLEAGFDLEPSADGTTPVDQLKGVKMDQWDQVKLDWGKIEQSHKSGVARFQANLAAYMKELEGQIPKGANVLFVHTMAGGVPRAKIMMPTMNKVFKGTGDRYVESRRLMESDLGKFSKMNFDEVTANTFQYLIEASSRLRTRLEGEGARVSYVAYGYHGTEVLVKDHYEWQTYTPYFQGWAKMRLEAYAEDAWRAGIKATVFNCPEILTNSSSIFQGVELSLYPLMGALRKEGAGSPVAEKIVSACRAKLKDEHSVDEVMKFTDTYIRSDLMQSYMKYEEWPQNNGKEQMEYMLGSSDHLIGMHKDPKDLITFLLSEEVFKSTGTVMFNESWQPREPVWWLGHDVLAKQIIRNG